jgi:hypothetical protein
MHGFCNDYQEKGTCCERKCVCVLGYFTLATGMNDMGEHKKKVPTIDLIKR